MRRAALAIDASSTVEDRTIDIFTTGRRSGEARRIQIALYRLGDDFCLIGSLDPVQASFFDSGDPPGASLGSRRRRARLRPPGQSHAERPKSLVRTCSYVASAGTQRLRWLPHQQRGGCGSEVRGRSLRRTRS